MSHKLTCMLLLFLTLSACHKKDDRRAETERIITEWVGKTIQMPDDIKFSIYGKDTAFNAFNTPYKIMFFTDSTGCTSCKLKLFEWQRLITEIDSTYLDEISFFFCFQPKNKEELIFLFKRDKFDYPVFIDEKNEMNQLNNFPEKAEYQCFLLDKNNKVISIGNPIFNPKIWDLYKQIITGQITIDSQMNTLVKVIDKEIELRNVKTGAENKMTFRIKNTGTVPLVITDVKTSCGCTNASWEKQPIEQNKTTKIKANIILENQGYFEKTLSVYCNVVNSPLTLIVKGNANK